MGTALQHHFHHGMGAQRAVQLVELIAAGGGDGDGHTQVIAALAFPQFDGGRVKPRVKLFGNQRDRVNQAIDFVSHHLDGERAGIFDQGLGAGNLRQISGCWSGGHVCAFLVVGACYA